MLNCIKVDDNNTRSNLRTACQTGNIEAAIILVTDEWSAMFEWSCGSGQLEFAKWLMLLGVHIDVDAAFVPACRNGYIDIVKWLVVQHTTPPSFQLWDYAVNAACVKDHCELVTWLISAHPGALQWSELLTHATIGGSVRVMTMLLQDHADIYSDSYSYGCVACGMHVPTCGPCQRHRWGVSNERRDASIQLG